MAVPTQRFNVVQVADVDTGVINWVNADLVTHICPGLSESRLLTAGIYAAGPGLRLPVVRRSLIRRLLSTAPALRPAFGKANR